MNDSLQDDATDPPAERLASVKILGSLDDDCDGLELIRVYRYAECNNETETESSSTASAGAAEAWVEQGSRLLQQQWPRGAAATPGESYRQKMIHSYHGRVEFYGLPCSYLLLKDDVCVGHGRLTECFESAGGNAAAATFIVIDSKFRGQGFGRHLMKGLEKEAERLGYHYVYLWTKTAIPFYQNIGYQECQRVSLKRACLKSLDASQVETLEALLFRKSQRQQPGEHQSSSTTTSRITSSKKSAKKTTRIQAETIMLPPSNDDEDENAQDVWLRKRLVEHVGSIHVPSSQRQEELADTVSRHAADSGSPPPGPQEESLKWRYFLLSLPWQKQIGPSCGLAALRMIREYFFSKALDGSGSSSSRNDMDEQHALQLPSLLGEAQERGYTQDGEVFNANHLMDIAETVCGLDCEMWSTKDLQPQQVWNTLRDGAVLLLPYDSNARTRRPALFGGKGAHYGIIVGLLVGTRTGTIVGVTKCKDEMPILEVVGGGEERSTAGFFVDFEAADDDDDPMCYFYLLVQHSLSSRLSIARWSDFLLSNQQLDSVDHDKYGAQDLDLKNRVIHCRGMRPDAF